MNTSPAVSLVFVNYRSAQYLAAALESLFSFEKEADFFEVIVVNNDPSENAALLALKQTFSFLLIESGGNTGFSRGNNLGAKRARGEVLGFINPDVLWVGVSLQKIARAFDEDSRLGVLGMALLTLDRKPEAWSVGAAPCLATLLLNNLFPARRTPWLGQKPFFSDWVSGCALFVRKELFVKVGGFDERFFLYFEDVDLCEKVRHRGFSVACHPEIPLIHLGGKSQKSQRLQKQYFLLSQREYFYKYRPKWEGAILRCLQSITKRSE